jgi:hypothetical protein
MGANLKIMTLTMERQLESMVFDDPQLYTCGLYKSEKWTHRCWQGMAEKTNRVERVGFFSKADL